MAAWSALEERALWHDDGRLSTPQDDHVVCGHEPPGRDRDRCLHAPTHSQRVDPVLAVNRSADPTGQTTPPHFGQLFRPQNPGNKTLVGPPPAISFPLRPHQLLVAQYSGAILPRSDREAYPPRHLF